MSKWKALIAASGFTFFLSTQANAQDDPLTVIYLGAKDCRPCQVFERYQKETFKQKNRRQRNEFPRIQSG
jgi:hypothetical protein